MGYGLDLEALKMLKEEYVRLSKQILHFKELARIDLDLLTLCTNVEMAPEVKDELDKMHDLVQAIMNEEKVYVSIDNLFDDKMSELEDLEEVEEHPKYLQALRTLASLDQQLAQLASSYTQEEMIDAFGRVVEHSHNKMVVSVKKEDITLALDFSSPSNNTDQIKYTQFPPQPLHTPEVTDTYAMDVASDSQDPHHLKLKMEEIQGSVVMTSDLTKRRRMRKKLRQSSPRHRVAFEHGYASPSPLQNSKGENFKADGHGHQQECLTMDGSTESQTISSSVMTNQLDEQLGKIMTKKRKKKKKGFDGTPCICERCGKTLKNKNSLSGHLRIHAKKDNKDFQNCPVCNKVCINAPSYLQAHIRWHSTEKPFVCHICGKAFIFKHRLAHHLNSHAGLKPHVCVICGKTFVSFSNMKRHQIIHTGEKPFTCSICGKAFTTRETKNSHERQHTKNYRYHCAICQKGFYESHPLKVHQNVHTKEKFPCLECNKIFHTKAILNVHKKVHVNGSTTVDAAFKCPTCGEGFHSFNKYVTHRRFHKEKDPFHCHLCGKSYSSYASLNVHKKGHRGIKVEVKPSECKICGKKFHSKNTMVRHTNIIHLGLKPFKCLVCGRQFAQNETLKSHMWTHKTEKRYNCQDCDKGFNDKRNLLSHCSKIHTVASSEGLGEIDTPLQNA